MVFRVVLEGGCFDHRYDDPEVGSDGFFAIEIVRGEEPLMAVQHAADRFVTIPDFSLKRIEIVAVWRPGFVVSLRRKPFGLVFFDREARIGAADLVANIACAPKSSAIRRIAAEVA